MNADASAMRVETQGTVPDQQIACRKCGSPLPGAEDRSVLKYFLPVERKTLDCFVAIAPRNDQAEQIHAPASIFASMKPEAALVPAPGQVEAPTMYKRSIGVR